MEYRGEYFVTWPSWSKLLAEKGIFEIGPKTRLMAKIFTPAWWNKVDFCNFSANLQKSNFVWSYFKQVALQDDQMELMKNAQKMPIYSIKSGVNILARYGAKKEPLCHGRSQWKFQVSKSTRSRDMALFVFVLRLVPTLFHKNGHISAPVGPRDLKFSLWSPMA